MASPFAERVLIRPLRFQAIEQSLAVALWVSCHRCSRTRFPARVMADTLKILACSYFFFRDIARGGPADTVITNFIRRDYKAQVNGVILMCRRTPRPRGDNSLVMDKSTARKNGRKRITLWHTVVNICQLV